MPRLIEVARPVDCPRALTLAVGDVLRFTATGARVRSGTSVALLGPFVPAEVAPDGRLVSPAGPPTAVLLVARERGRATVDVVTGDPWRAPVTTTLEVTVQRAE